MSHPACSLLTIPFFAIHQMFAQSSDARSATRECCCQPLPVPLALPHAISENIQGHIQAKLCLDLSQFAAVEQQQEGLD